MGTKIFFGDGPPEIRYYQAQVEVFKAQMEFSRMRAALLGITLPAQRLADAWATVTGPVTEHSADCAGCGAPLQRLASVCAYCRRPHN